MRKTLPLAALLLPLLLVVPKTATADPVQIGLTFTVKQMLGNGSELFGVPLTAGTVFTGLLTYDPSDAYPRDVGSAWVSLQIGSGLQTPLSIGITDGVYDFFSAQGTPLLPGFYPGGWLFVDFISPPSAISSVALPQSVAEFLAAFSSGRLFLHVNRPGSPDNGFDSATHELMADMEASVVTPEPGSMLLLGTGLVGLARFAARRRQKQG